METPFKCNCDNSHARTLRKLNDDFCSCPRCGGLVIINHVSSQEAAKGRECPGELNKKDIDFINQISTFVFNHISRKDWPHELEMKFLKYQGEYGLCSEVMISAINDYFRDKWKACHGTGQAAKVEPHDKEVEGWEKEFDNTFLHSISEETWLKDSWVTPKAIKKFIRQLLAQKQSTGMTELQLENFLDKIYHNWNPDSGEDLKWHNYLARALLATFSGVGVGRERLAEALVGLWGEDFALGGNMDSLADAIIAALNEGKV